MEAIGYQVQAFVIPACAVNAPHRRGRVWIVANQSSKGLERDAGTNSYIRRVFFKVANRTMGGAEKTLLTPGLWKGRRISAREHLMHMHQYMGCMFRYAVETRLWKSGPAMGFGDRNYVRSLARIFAKGIRA